MFDETHTTHDTGSGAGTPRRSAPGQLRPQLPAQSAPVTRGRVPEGWDATDGAAASGLLGKLGGLLDNVLPF
ncbi:hypothetical protein AB0A60_27385 [Streptomyces sp. NPDC046275]|uniref:hypothetical protein n=1 Tax=Streptomyces sp. NPDC046275 TaxID=3157201 RepID=UPI0033FF584A